MKTAKEMFEELGYVKDEDERLICFRLKSTHQNVGVVFNKINKGYHSYINWYQNGIMPDESNLKIQINLHLAIHQQMKELGWIE